MGRGTQSSEGLRKGALPSWGELILFFLSFFKLESLKCLFLQKSGHIFTEKLVEKQPKKIEITENSVVHLHNSSPLNAVFHRNLADPCQNLKGKRTKKMRLHNNSVVHLHNSFPSVREKQKWEGRSGGMEGSLHSPLHPSVFSQLSLQHTHTAQPPPLPPSSALSNRHTSLVHYYSPGLPKRPY